MMATEQVEPDPRHEAIVALHRAISEAEAGDRHAAETAAHTALAWLREMPSSHPIQSVALSEPTMRECSCGRPRQRGTFCKVCCPELFAPTVNPR